MERRDDAHDWVAVYGTGVMAVGLARLCRRHGYSVLVLSATRGRAQQAAERVVAESGAGEVSSDPARLADCALVLEGTVEDLGRKRTVLGDIERKVPEDALIATTTSSLPITELATKLAIPERFLGLHFFNPPTRMKLVEVVAGARTSDETVQRGHGFLDSVGKEGITVADKAGFVVNRLLIPYLNRAARFVEAGHATIEDVDTAMMLGASHPLGPFALIDLIGADVTVAIGRSLYEEFKRPGDAPSPELVRRVALGWLGRKTGRGYREHPRNRGR